VARFPTVALGTLLLLGPQPGRQWVRLGPEEAEPAVRIGQEPQLLVDDALLGDTWRVRRVQGVVRKHPLNPVIRADQPWEQESGRTSGLQPTAALYDARDGLFKLWYSILQPRAKEGSATAYATSRDGVAWSKPDLRLVEYAGTQHNNVCRLEPFGKPPRGLHLIDDRRNRPDERRFQAIGTWPLHDDGTWYGCWLGIAVSADGTTWRQLEGGVREGAGGGRPSCFWDERVGRYVLFHRQLTESALSERHKRYVVRQESVDLVRWSARVKAFNPIGGAWPEVESMNVFRRGGLYLGLAYMLDIDVSGAMEIHLVTSRDGVRWEQPFPDAAFVPRGAPGEFDDTLVYCGQPVIHGDEMRFYYAGTRYSHAKPTAPIVDDGGSLEHLPRGKGRLDPRPNQIGLATLPLDRFAGLRADEPVGAFLTRPILVEGEDLYVNARVDRELRVEVVDPVARVVDTGPKEDWTGHYLAGREEIPAGYARTDCAAVTGDSLRHRVRWRGGALGRFKGRAVRLRFLARMATVYAFQVR
jgi:hypothetical protein